MMRRRSADAAHAFVIVDGGDQHLRRAFHVAFGRGDVFQNGLKQRPQVGRGLIQIQRGRTGAGGGVHDGPIQRGLVRAQFNEQIQHLVHHFLAAGVGPVDLVDDHDNGQLQAQRLAQHKTGLGHGAFEAVHQQKHAVHHLQNALHLAAEIGVAGRVNDIDLGLLIMNGGILCQNGDAALPLDIVGVHHALRHLLVLAEHAALLEHFVHQRGLAVVNVRDNGNVAKYLP